MTCSRELTTFSFNDFLIGPLLLGGSLLSRGGGGPFSPGFDTKGKKNQRYFQGAVIFVNHGVRGWGAGGGGGRKALLSELYTRKKT